MYMYMRVSACVKSFGDLRRVDVWNIEGSSQEFRAPRLDGQQSRHGRHKQVLNIDS